MTYVAEDGPHEYICRVACDSGWFVGVGSVIINMILSRSAASTSDHGGPDMTYQVRDNVHEHIQKPARGFDRPLGREIIVFTGSTTAPSRDDCVGAIPKNIVSE